MDFNKSDKLSDINNVLNEKLPDYYSDVFTPGATKQQLEIGKEVKAPGIAVGSFTVTATGNISITGVGFTPKAVKFDAVTPSVLGTYGVGAMDKNGNQYGVNYVTTNISTTDAIYIGNPVTTRFSFVSMDSSGFTVNCTYFTANTTIGYVAFG